ncbi:hypothetical protein SCOR_09975 [Sulfidibacter corallicola]|uniref:TraG P-loop domain-containing protein n=1 Tax=Sulfidibacter corallicola TaxID=2818388 RepID=A0A8A4TMZ7_SULCO|nr:hypothetical protein [Sulfidibacter corallicola]QTD50920.1 hypothetical protein J3U87_00495 [Sulfidibacter corallicola]
MNSIKEYGRFCLLFGAATIGGGMIMGELFLLMRIHFNPIPILIACALIGLAAGYLVLFQHYGPFVATWLAQVSETSLSRFTADFQEQRSPKGAPYLVTPSGPRFFFRLVLDPVEFDKTRETPPRLATLLETLNHFESVSLLTKKVAIRHTGYACHQTGFLSALMQRVNETLPTPREALVIDVAVSAEPDQIDNVNLFGLALKPSKPATMYHTATPLPMQDYLGGLGMTHGVRLVTKPDTVPFVRCMDGRLWTVLECSGFHAADHGDTGSFDRLQKALDAELVLFTHYAIPSPEEVRRASAVSSLTQIAAGWFFRHTAKDFDPATLEHALSDYRDRVQSAPTHCPRQLRGLVLIGREIPWQSLEGIRYQCRDKVGLDVTPLPEGETTRALLSLIPGWEGAAAGLGHHSLGFNACPSEIVTWLSQVTGSWVGDLGQRAYLVIETPDGNSFSWSPWQDTAYNSVVVGETGSGKSFLLNMKVLAHVASSPMARTLLLDYGESFLNLTRLCGGRVIDKHQRDPVTGEAYRFAPLACLGEDAADLPAASLDSLLEDAAILTMDLWLYKVNLANFAPPTDEGGLRNLFDGHFKEMIKVAVRAFSFDGETFGRCLNHCAAYLDAQDTRLRHETTPDAANEREAVAHLRRTLNAVRALRRTYLAESATALRFADPGSFTYINLDGYPDAEIAELLPIMLINAAQLTTRTVGVPTLFLIDEYKKLCGFQGGDLVGDFVEAYLNIVRKYHVAMTLSSQRVAHFSPGILEATQTHLALIQDMTAAPSAWRIKDPTLVHLARDASPAADVGYSTVTLAKKTGSGSPVQIGGRLRVPPILVELFESNKNLKRLAGIVGDRLGVATHQLALAAQKGDAYRPIASPGWYRALAEAFPEQGTWLQEAAQVLTPEGMQTGKAQGFLARTPS